jgi:hypothetical protein
VRMGALYLVVDGYVERAALGPRRVPVPAAPLLLAVVAPLRLPAVPVLLRLPLPWRPLHQSRRSPLAPGAGMKLTTLLKKLSAAL